MTDFPPVYMDTDLDQDSTLSCFVLLQENLPVSHLVTISRRDKLKQI